MASQNANGPRFPDTLAANGDPRGGSSMQNRNASTGSAAYSARRCGTGRSPAVRCATVLLAATAFPVALLALDVTVTDAPYNAAGNGTTNDRVAIQNAVNDVFAAGGGTVTVPSGKTFLTGTVQIKSHVTIRIDGTLQSSLNTSHYPYETQTGRRFSSSVAWDDKYLWNYPVIWGDSATHRVKVTGSGTIRIGEVSGAGDNSQIFVSPVGFFRVDTFEISGISMRRGKGYHIQLHECNNGRITRVDIRDVYNGSDWNCDGVSIMNCQNIRVDSNYICANDDCVYPWVSYNDPRGKRWWNSRYPQPSRDIEIDHNTLAMYVRGCGPSDINCIMWGGRCPDLSRVELSGLYIHHNHLSYCSANSGSGINFREEPVQILDGGSAQPAWNPAKDWTIVNNTSDAGICAPFIGSWDVTNLHFPGYTKRSPSTFKNAGFETNGIPYWSVRPNPDPMSAGARNDAVGQNGAWYGYIDKLNLGDARIFQGLYRSAGNHQFSARVQSSGAAVRMSVRDNNDAPVACREFSNTGWTTLTLDWTAQSAGNYRIGIERGAATSGWARIDDASVSSGGSGGSGGCSATAIEPANRRVRPVAQTTVSAGAITIRGSAGAAVALSGIDGRTVLRTALDAGGSVALKHVAAGTYVARIDSPLGRTVMPLVVSR